MNRPLVSPNHTVAYTTAWTAEYVDISASIERSRLLPKETGRILSTWSDCVQFCCLIVERKPDRKYRGLLSGWNIGYACPDSINQSENGYGRHYRIVTRAGSAHRETRKQKERERWSGRRESNPRLRLGKPRLYHWATAAQFYYYRPVLMTNSPENRLIHILPCSINT